MAKAKVADLKVWLADLARKTYSARLLVDDARMQADLGKIMTQLRTLGRQVASPKISLEGAARAENTMLALAAQMDALSGKIVKAHIQIDDGDSQRRLALLTVELVAMQKRLTDLRLKVSDSAALAKIEVLKAALGEISDKVARINFKTDLPDIMLAEEAVSRFRREIDSLDPAMAAAAEKAARFWRGWATLGNKIPLFGGVFSHVGGLNQIVGYVSAWHLLVDAVIEFGAVLIPATVAFAAFAAAAEPAVEDVVNHLKAAQTVTLAFGQAVPPMTNAFTRLGDAIRPDIYQLYGDALMVINRQTGLFTRLAEDAGAVIDHFGARIARVFMSQGAGTFLSHAIGDLNKLFDIIGNLGGVVGAFFKVMPGYAQVLLNLADVASKALEGLAHLAEPLIGIGLYAHGAWLYSGLLATGLLKLIPLAARLTGGMSEATKAAGGFDRIKLAAADLGANIAGIGSKISSGAHAISSYARGVVAIGKDMGVGAAGSMVFGDALGLLTKIPVWGWVAAGVVALGGLTIWMLRTKDATQKWIDSLQAGINKSSFGAVTGNLISSLAKVNAAYAKARIATRNAGESTSHYGVTVRGNLLAMAQSVQKQNELSAAQKAFAGQLSMVGYRSAELVQKFGSVNQGLALLTMAGIKATDMVHANRSAWALDLLQVDGMIQGYKGMGVSATALGRDVEALTLAGSDQVKQMQQIDSATSAFMQIVTGGAAGFASFETQMKGMALAAGGVGTKLEVSSGKAHTFVTTSSAIAKTAQHAHATMTGLNSASLQLQQTFYQSLTSAQKYYQALAQQAAVAQLGAKGQQLLTRAARDMLAQLLPLASESKTARDSVFALAQTMGYKGVDSIRAMTRWVGPGGLTQRERDLQGVTQTLAGSVSNLDKDYRKITTTLQTDVVGMLSKVALQTSGAQTAALRLTTALQKQGPASTTAHNWYEKLITDLHHSGLSWSQARQYAEAYTKGLGYNWREIQLGQGPRTRLQGDMEKLAGQLKMGDTPQTHDFRTALGQLFTDIASHHTTRQQLITDLINTGEKAHLSNRQIATLISTVLRIPAKKALQIVMGATGSGHLTLHEQMLGQKAGGYLEFHAAGGIVGGRGHGDSTMAMLTPGELVVPKHMVARGAVDHLRGKLPGFAAGGLVPGISYTGNPSVLTGQFAVNAANSTAGRLGGLGERMVQSAMGAILHAIAQQASTLLTSRAGAHGPLQQYARKLLAAYGWASQWGAFNSIVMRESGWNVHATNPSSGAYGIPQALPGSKMASAGADWRTDGYTQLRWMMSYLKSAYGSPAAGWAHETHYGWYDSGGMLPPGLSLMFNGLGRHERLTPGPPGGHSGGDMHIIVRVDPVIAAATPSARLGQHIAENLKMAIKGGTRLYPPGMPPR